MTKLVITRHSALLQYLVETGIIPGATTYDHDVAYCSRCGMDLYHISLDDCEPWSFLPMPCHLCTSILAHAEPDDVRGKDVIGVLPLSLAALANTVTEIPLTLPAELRGKELTLAQVRALAGSPITYVAQTRDDWNYTACLERTAVEFR